MNTFDKFKNNVKQGVKVVLTAKFQFIMRIHSCICHGSLKTHNRTRFFYFSIHFQRFANSKKNNGQRKSDII